MRRLLILFSVLGFALLAGGLSQSGVNAAQEYTHVYVGGSAQSPYFPFLVDVTSQTHDPVTNDITVDLEITPKADIPYAVRTNSSGVSGDYWSGSPPGGIGEIVYFPNWPTIEIPGLVIHPGGQFSFEAVKGGFDLLGLDSGDAPGMILWDAAYLYLKLLRVSVPIPGDQVSEIVSFLEAFSLIPGLGAFASAELLIKDIVDCIEASACDLLRIIDNLQAVLEHGGFAETIADVANLLGGHTSGGEVQSAMRGLGSVFLILRFGLGAWDMLNALSELLFDPWSQVVTLVNPNAPVSVKGVNVSDGSGGIAVPPPPQVAVVVSPDANDAGWNSSPVSIDWIVVGETSSLGCVDETVNGETGWLVRVCSATNSGGTTTKATRVIRIDMTPPVTGAALDPSTPNGKRGWYDADVSVCLTATDPLLSNGDPPSGVRITRYRLNSGSWQEYGGCFAVGDEGWNEVQYYSEDLANNAEAIQAVRFKIDKTVPEIGITSGTIDEIVWDQAHLERGILTNQGTLALVGAASDNLCLWEVRAVDVDSGLTTASQQPADPNVPDWPPPYPPSSLGYLLNVPLHTGINTIDITAEDCAGWTKAVRIQVVYVVPARHDPRTKGFWYEAVKTKKYSTSEMQTFLDYINVASDVWGNDPTRNRYGPLTLSNYRAVLGVPDSANMELKMKAQLLANWLNMVSGRLAIKTPVDVSSVPWHWFVMDDIGGNPLTFAYKVDLEIEEKVQPGAAIFIIDLAGKNLAAGINTRAIIVYP